MPRKQRKQLRLDDDPSNIMKWMLHAYHAMTPAQKRMTDSLPSRLMNLALAMSEVSSEVIDEHGVCSQIPLMHMREAMGNLDMQAIGEIMLNLAEGLNPDYQPECDEIMNLVPPE